VKILKVWDAEYPWDVRLEKVMRSLTGGGHDVHLVARNRRGEPLLEELEEATVHRLRPWSGLGSTLDAASQFPAFMNPRWSSHMVDVGRKVGAELVIVRDLPLAPTAIKVGRKLGVPVIMDMAENYPAMIRDIWIGGRQGRFDFLVRNPAFVAAVERWSLRRLDHTIVVVEESGQRLEALGVESDRITVVCNTPWKSRIPDRAPLEHRENNGPLRLVYLGLLETPRGLDAVLQGLATLRDDGLETTLDIVGGGRDEEHFMSEARRLGFDDETVRFHGVLPYEQALALFRRADIGLVPHLAVESWNTTIPNKLFDYMSHLLPVITSDAKPAERIVETEQSGVVFRSGDAADFARAVRELETSEARARFGRNGRDAVERRYNWDHDADSLLSAVQRTCDVYARTRNA
jgi:glycosyltransferase involved in cell wall biosynthesis